MSALIDAIDLATFSRERARWMTAIQTAIQLDAKHNKGAQVSSLANLGQYLSEDLREHMAAEANRLQRERVNP